MGFDFSNIKLEITNKGQLMEPLPDWRLAQTMLPTARSSRDLLPKVRELLLVSYLAGGMMPTTVTSDDLEDVESLIRKLEAIASNG